MAEPMSTSAAAGGALIKIFGLPVLAGSLAAALGFMFMWPKTKGEAFARFATSIIFSATAGPLLVVWLRSYSPELFERTFSDLMARGRRSSSCRFADGKII